MDSAKRLTKRQTDKLLHDSHAIRDVKTDERLQMLGIDFTEAWSLGNGQFILRLSFDGTSTLYLSYNGVEEFLKTISAATLSYENGRGEGHILSRIFPFGRDFPEHVAELTDILVENLGIERSRLMDMKENLRVIDSVLRLSGDQIRQPGVRERLFPALVAYSGEVVRNTVEGEWEMKPADGNAVRSVEIWEPYIRAKDGTLYATYDIVWDAIYEWNEPLSISSIVSAALAPKLPGSIAPGRK